MDSLTDSSNDGRTPFMLGALLGALRNCEILVNTLKPVGLNSVDNQVLAVILI